MLPSCNSPFSAQCPASTWSDFITASPQSMIAKCISLPQVLVESGCSSITTFFYTSFTPGMGRFGKQPLSITFTSFWRTTLQLSYLDQELYIRGCSTKISLFHHAHLWTVHKMPPANKWKFHINNRQQRAHILDDCLLCLVRTSFNKVPFPRKRNMINFMIIWHQGSMSTTSSAILKSFVNLITILQILQKILKSSCQIAKLIFSVMLVLHHGMLLT